MYELNELELASVVGGSTTQDNTANGNTIAASQDAAVNAHHGHATSIQFNGIIQQNINKSHIRY